MSDESAAERGKDARLATLAVHIERILKLVDGNGKPGLPERLQHVEITVAALEKKLDNLITDTSDHQAETREAFARLEKTTAFLELQHKARVDLDVKRENWWDRFGFEIVKVFIGALSAAITAYLLLGLDLIR